MPNVSDIVNKKFSRAFMGYDMREVDAFLDELIDQIELYEREKQEMMTAMEYLLRELEQFDEIENDLDRGLTAAEEDARKDDPSDTTADDAVVIENEVSDTLSFVEQEEPLIEEDIPVADVSGDEETVNMDA